MRYLLLRLKRFCGFITGFVFFISGILKLLDPVGAGLVIEQYFKFMHIGFMGAVAGPLGLLLAFAETLLGTALITGVWRRISAIVSIAMQGCFTLLTLALVIFNPDMDCGCFGEAVDLTHTQTFVKNIILMALLLTYYIPAKHLGEPKKRKYVSFGIVSLSVTAFAAYSAAYIPLVDFTDFKPAAALQAGHAFATPEEETYEAVFIYEKDGIRERFDIEHLPDSTWSFVSTETTLKPGNHSGSVVSLSFSDKNGKYADSLAAEGKIMVISVYDMDMKDSKWRETARFMKEARQTGFRPLLLVSETPEKAAERLSALPEDIQKTIEPAMFYSDYKTLITMNRSNGGATFFSDGYLIRKWAQRALPDTVVLAEQFNGDDTESIIGHHSHKNLTFQGFLLYVFAVMLLL